VALAFDSEAQSMIFTGLCFTVLEKEATQIMRLRIQRLPGALTPHEISL